MRIVLLLALFILSAANVLAQTPPPGSTPTAPRDVERRVKPNEPAPKREQQRSPMLERLEHEKDAAVKNAPHIREILIFADSLERLDILGTLEQQNIQGLKTYVLPSIESVLFIIMGNDVTFQALRNQLPNAEIDWNDDLVASKGPRLYAKEKIKWPDQGACLDGALKIPIGMIDGSIDQSHPAFAGQRIFEKNFLEDKKADQAHATAIGSILIGNDVGQGFGGLLTGAKLYNAVALRRAPNDKQLASVEATLRGLDWLMSKNVRLINVSLAGKKNRVLVKAFERSLEQGGLIFAAAGNNGPGAPPIYPAAIEGVFAVTAVDVMGRPYKAANTGDYLDFAAPGVDIWAATPDGSGSYKSGTSYAVPYALGAAALILKANKSMSLDVLKKSMFLYLKENKELHIKCNI